MRPHALLPLLLALALHARAASIPDHIVPELEARLSEAVKQVLDKDAGSLKDDLADQALIDQVNDVASLPVEVVDGEDGPASVDKRESVAADLENPGPPQSQKHDAQNPEGFDDAKLKEASLSHSIAETQNFLHQGLLKINENAQNPHLDQEKLSQVKNNINELQKNFNRYIYILNEGAKLYANPEISADLRTALGPESDAAFALKKTETEFNSGIEGSEKADGAQDNTGTTAAPFNIVNWFVENVKKAQEQIQSNMNNIGNTFNTWVNNNNGTQTLQTQPQQQQQKPTAEQQQWHVQILQNIQSAWTNLFGGATTTTTASPQKEPVTTSTSEAPAPESKPDEQKEEIVASQSTRTGEVEQLMLKSPVVQGIAGAMQKVQGSVTEAEEAKDAVEPSLKGHFGHGGGPGSEYSDDSDVIGLMNENEAMKDEMKIDTTLSPILAEERKDENVADDGSLELTTKVESSMYKEEPTQETIVEMTTKVEEMQKMEESDANAEVSIVDRIKEEISATEDYKEDMQTTGLPLTKEITTINNDLMLGDEPKLKEITTLGTLLKDEYKAETTTLPVKEIEISSEEVPVTEAMMEMFIKDGLLVDNTLNKDTVELEVSGTEASEMDVATKKEELTTSNEYMKVEESALTTSQPAIEVEFRNVDVETATEDVSRNTELPTTLQPSLEEKLEILPKNEEADVSTTEIPQGDEIKKEQIKKEKHKGKSSESREKKRNPKVIRRLIKRTLL